MNTDVQFKIKNICEYDIINIKKREKKHAR